MDNQPESSLSAATLPVAFQDQIEKMKLAAENLRSAHYDITGGVAQLRGAVKVLSTRVTDIDAQGSLL